ncbi:MAG: carboxypeptidase regulatory-like domain-containing protein, partial [Bryobacterales bacterium]|nr:carboxypeptidase regulatory-like domain-containing protein [Bryobacterales bacterium]
MKTRILLVLLVCCALLRAQGERGTLNGTVTDPTGAVIPGATVRALNVATGVETTVQTTAAGVYRIPYLPPGTYKITVSAPGFKTAVRENVTLGVAQTLTVDFTLEVGAVTDQITVSAEPPLLETGTAEIGYYVTKHEFDTWPITVGDGRRQIQQFIFTALPGTVGGTWEGSISGGQLFSHEILIDGISLGRMDITGGSNNEFSPSAEAISEFKLQTGMVSAQYTGGQTAVANFATKSGTNELHGSAYYYLQNDALRANSWSNNAAGIKRTPFKQHNLGYSAGGPVWLGQLYDGRNKTFFFHNFEYTRARDFASLGFSTLPTNDFKQGNFSRLFDPNFTGNASSGRVIGTDALGRPVVFGAIYDPTTSRQVGNTWVRDPFPGNIIPRNRWSPVSQKILELAPITDPVFDTMLNNIPNLSSCCPVFSEKMLTLRGDHNFSVNHRLAVTFNRNFRARFNSPSGRWGRPPGTPTGVYIWQDTPGTLGRVAYTWTISPTVVNHFAGGYNRFGNKYQSAFVEQDWPQKIGIQNVPGTHFPVLWFTSGAVHQGRGIGAGGQLGVPSASISYNGSTIYQNHLTIVRGAHNFKVGFEQRRYYYNTRPRSNESGQFWFSPAQTSLPGFSTQTGHAFASFLLGAVSSSSRAVVTTFFGHRWRSTGWYFMDDWKVTRKLTINMGLRWETIGGLFEVARRQATFSFDRPNPRAGNRPGALIWVDELNRKSFQDRYWWQMAPKFGLAYAVSPNLVLRAGYGINSMAPLSYDWGFAGGQGFNASISISSATVPLSFAEEQVMWLHDRYPDFRGTLPNKDPSIANGTGVNYFARDSNRLGYMQNWSLGFQYQLPQAFVLEVNYVANKGTRLEAEGLDNLNAVPVSALALGQMLTDPWTAASGVPIPFPGFSGTVLQALRPFPQYTSIGQQFANFGT